jgi:lipopolysaccharide export system permease protein
VYLAERGQTAEQNGTSYLVLQKGSVQRKEPNSRDSSIVAFERYAVDLSAFNREGGEVIYKPRERSTLQLLFPDKSEPIYQEQSGRFRAELHERLSSWLYPLAMMMIAFAALGEPRTTRQGRGVAIASAVVAIVLMRILGFAASSGVARTPAAVVAIYAVPLASILISLLLILQGPAMRSAQAKFLRMLNNLLPARSPAIQKA